MLIVALIFFIWVALGISGYEYWWHRDFNEYDSLPFPGVIVGPFAWIIGGFIHRSSKKLWGR